MSVKVAIFLFYPYGGGMYHYCLSLAHSLSKYCRIFFFYPIDSPSPKPSKNFIPIPINFKWGIKMIWTSIPAFIKVYYLLLKIKPDIIHFPSNHILLGVFSTLISPYFPIISTFHDPVFHPEDRILPRIVDRKLLIHSSDLIIVHDYFGKKGLANQYPKANIKVIKLLCIQPILKELPLEKNDMGEYALFFGRLSLYKGLEVLIKASRIIKMKNPDVKILIAGRGRLGKTVVNYANKAENIVIRNKFISDNEIPQIFSSSLFIVLPYTSATQSGVIPIAYYYKKPVITTNIGGLPESVVHEETGLVIEANNPVSLADSIMKMWEDRAKTLEMGINGYKWMKENISSEKIAQETYKTYLTIIKRKKK